MRPDVPPAPPRISVEEYHRLDEFNENRRRTELICGSVIEKIPKSPLHSSIRHRLYTYFLKCLPAEYVVRSNDPLTLADSEPEPDLAVVQGEISDFYEKHPSIAALVIEVAVSSVALDRELASLYAEAGVTEYWIALAATRQVEVYRNPIDGRYRAKAIFGEDQQIECVGIPGICVPVSEIFVVTP